MVQKGGKPVGYPFYENPLDDYLRSSFSLRFEELNLEVQLQEKSLPSSERKYLGAQLVELRSQMAELKFQCSLKPRNFDIFLSGPEMAVERFKLEFPEPEPFFLCSHTEKRLTKRIFRDGTIHVVAQCMVCGSSRGAKARGNLNVDSLPEFDADLKHEGNTYRSWWESERFRIYYDAKGKGNEIPEFDYEAFSNQFELTDPIPLVLDCRHPKIEARLRVYNSMQSAVVEQCLVCGKHVQSIKKAPGWESLPHFDVELRPVLEQKIHAWNKRKQEAQIIALADHKKDVMGKIARGEISTQDNSKFGNYYGSEEWKKTRKRILGRDEQRCQACGAAAECVHHIVYDRLGAENDLDLISLCHSCHDAIHREQRRFYNLYRMPPADISTLCVNDH